MAELEQVRQYMAMVLHTLDGRGDRSQRGDIVQNVIWIALFAAAAIAIAGIIIAKFTGKAENIPTG